MYYFWCAYQKCSHAIGFVPLQSLQKTYKLGCTKKPWLQMSMFPEIIPITLGWCRPHPPQRAGRWFSPHRGVGPAESGSSALHRSRHCPGDLGQPIHNLGRSRNSVWWLSHQPPIPKKMTGSFQSSIPVLLSCKKRVTIWNHQLVMPFWKEIDGQVWMPNHRLGMTQSTNLVSTRSGSLHSTAASSCSKICKIKQISRNEGPFEISLTLLAAACMLEETNNTK